MTLHLAESLRPDEKLMSAIFRQGPMVRLLTISLLLLLVPARAGAAGPAGTLRTPSKAYEHLADLVIDINTDDLVIEDAPEDDDETAERQAEEVLCLAPPCGIKAEAVPLTKLPVPWILRLTSGSAWA